MAAAYGYASDQMSAVLDRAAVLARELGVNLPGPLLRAQAMAVLSGGDFDAALEAGARLGAHGGSEPLSVVEGGFVQGVASYWRGELAAAKAHLESAVAAYRPKDRADHLLLFGQDPQVLCIARLAHVHAFLGNPVAARRAQAQSLQLGRQTRHPFTVAVALLFGALLDLELGDLAAVREHVIELSELGDKVEAPMVQVVTAAFAGLAEVLDGGAGTGLARIDAALADPRRHTAPGVPSMLLRIRLAACQTARDPDGSRETAERLLAGGVRVWDTVARRALDPVEAAER